MSTEEIREKLYNYISIADDRKLNAIYILVEDEITENLHWWKDEAFTNELNERYSDYKSGRSKGYTLEEVEASINELKQKRQGR